ncbi:DUF4276 family protein [Candidatus Hepatincolaceae symbiont of Richtersius coronifer]
MNQIIINNHTPLGDDKNTFASNTFSVFVNNPKKIIKIGISVEGQTEAFFIKYVLSRYLRNHNIILGEPVVLGGNVTFPRISSVLSLLETQYDYVTCLYDFYGFDGKEEVDTYESLVGKIKNDNIFRNKDKIIPYIQMYEFEALLFSDINAMCKHFYNDPKEMEQCNRLLSAALAGKTPETINDSILTAPSKRIHRIFKRYKKSLYGYVIAQEIGVEKIKSMCPKFSNWIDNLIRLNSEEHQANIQENSYPLL